MSCSKACPAESGAWQSRITKISDGVRYIFQVKEFTDCEFHVGQKTYKAHRLVLSARSSKFAALLLEPNSAYENLVESDSVTPKGFEILLRFCYTDEIGTNDKSAIVEAFSAADYFQQPSLKTRCEEMITSWDISTDEVCNLLNVSVSVPVLQERCLMYIKNYAVEVISSDTFLDLKMNSLITLLEENILREVPLLKRIERIMEWGENRHTKPVNYAMIREDFLSCSPSLLKMIGLEQLGLDQFNKLFAVRGRYNGLITGDERIKFMDYFEDNDRSFLPEWMN